MSTHCNPIQLALAVLLTGPAAAQSVWNVANPAQPYASLQAAIDGAQAGDVLLLDAGPFDAATVSQKGLTLVALEGSADVRRGLRIELVPATAAVHLIGLSVTGRQDAAATPDERVALTITQCDGPVTLRDCTLRGGSGSGITTPNSSGGDALRVTSSPQVSLTSTTSFGGAGSGNPFGGPSPTTGGTGGAGIRAHDSRCASFDTTLGGGFGGPDGNNGGLGGEAARAEGPTSRLFLTDGAAVGGPGGLAVDIFPTCPGDGGAGLVAIGGASASLRGFRYSGGAAGQNVIPGQGTCTPSAGARGIGNIVPIDRSARQLGAPRWSADQAPLEIAVEGVLGDQVQLAITPLSAFALTSAGISLVDISAWTTATNLGVLSANGVSRFTVQLPDVMGGREAVPYRMQALVRDVSGRFHLSGAVTVVVFDRGASPDCDGNGSFDLLEVLEGSSADCQGDLLPDACQIAAGAALDCNANGVPDSCDLAAGTSVDLNLNGVPDECDPQPGTWFVDASAAPGGNGSALAPFDDLADAVAVAGHGDLVDLAAGTYRGPRNRNQVVQRNLQIVGRAGAGATILDAESLGRVFEVRLPATSLRLAGLTLRRGQSQVDGGLINSIGGADVRAADCVFEDGRSLGIGGGAISLNGAQLGSEFRRCTFARNRATAAGGAVQSNVANARFVACRFVDNVAGGDGGAISISGTQEVSSVISHSVFESNSAGRDGGALFFQTLRPMRVHESLFVGNEAGERGGAACFDDNGWSVYGCTFVGNHGGTRGGAVHGLAQPSVFVPFPREVTNSILVGNSAPIGSQIDVFNTSADFTVRHSIIEGGASGIQVSQLIAAFGPLVLDVDPRFVDPDGPDGDPLTYADNDYRLSPASPAIDAGSVPSIQPDTTDVDGNGDLNEPCPLDLALALRRRDDPSVVDTGAGTAPIVDMGAFERVP